MRLLARRSLLLAAAVLACIAAGGLACSDDEKAPQVTTEPTATAESETARPVRTPNEGVYRIVGPNDEYATISEAMEDALPGTIVIVHPGRYREQVEVPPGVTLEAYGDGTAVIDGECQRNHGAWIPSGSGSVVRGMEIRNTTGAAVMIGNGPDGSVRPDNVTVERNRISDFNCNEEDVQFNAGVAAWYTSCCIRVLDNVITYRTEGDPHGKGNGIWFKSNSDLPSGGGHTIAGNVITGGWDGIGGENEDDPHGTFDGNTLIERNWIRGCWDDGIQSEGGDENVRVLGNDISGCGTGIAVAPAITGPIFVEHNTIHDLVVGLYENRFCFKFGNEGSGEIRLTNNICATEGDGIAQTNSGGPTLVMQGNCIRVTRYVMELGDAQNTLLLENRLWTTDSSRFMEWSGQHYGSLGEFQQSTGQAEGSLQTPACPHEQNVDE